MTGPDHRTWWSPERVRDGLRRFHRERRCAPTNTEEYRAQAGGFGQKGRARRYPSTYAVLRYYPTFRQAWEAVGIGVDREYETWTPIEEWYLREAAGILSRQELAADLRRSPGAVHRHLGDLGLHTWQIHGWTSHRTERVAGVTGATIRKYFQRGELPYFRGNRCCYFDPADLLIVKEIDWQHPPADLAQAVRRSLVRRLVTILAGHDWRANRPYLSQPTRAGAQQRRARPDTPRPDSFAVDDVVRCVRPVVERERCLGFEGRIRAIFYRGQGHGPATPGKQWVARVDFRRRQGGGDSLRVVYTLPLEALERVRT